MWTLRRPCILTIGLVVIDPIVENIVAAMATVSYV